MPVEDYDRELYLEEQGLCFLGRYCQPQTSLSPTVLCNKISEERVSKFDGVMVREVSEASNQYFVSLLSTTSQVNLSGTYWLVSNVLEQSGSVQDGGSVDGAV